MYKKPIEWTPKRLKQVPSAIDTQINSIDSDIDTALIGSQKLKRLQSYAESAEQGESSLHLNTMPYISISSCESSA